MKTRETPSQATRCTIGGSFIPGRMQGPGGLSGQGMQADRRSQTALPTGTIIQAATWRQRRSIMLQSRSKASTLRTLAALICAATLASPAVHAQEYPLKPVRLIVPYAAGAGADLLARMAGQKLGQNLKQNILVEARPGGDTMIGARAALQAPADGYTLLLATTTTAIAPLVNKDPGYNFSQFEVLVPLSFDGFILSVNAGVPARNLAEFISHVKANPGKLNRGSLGSAGPIELISERFLASAGLDIVKVNYGGSGPALKDLAGGTIQVIVAGPVGTMPLVRSGHIRALAYTAGERNTLAPEIPTFRELGHPAIVGGVWYAIASASTVAEPIKRKLASEGANVLATSDFKEKLAAQGSTPWPGTLQDFISFIRSDNQLWEADIRRGAARPAS
jgi:tripartite-type tricarboxylate transporter receptor subunit TctC